MVTAGPVGRRASWCLLGCLLPVDPIAAIMEDILDLQCQKENSWDCWGCETAWAKDAKVSAVSFQWGTYIPLLKQEGILETNSQPKNQGLRPSNTIWQVQIIAKPVFHSSPPLHLGFHDLPADAKLQAYLDCSPQQVLCTEGRSFSSLAPFSQVHELWCGRRRGTAWDKSRLSQWILPQLRRDSLAKAIDGKILGEQVPTPCVSEQICKDYSCSPCSCGIVFLGS